MHIPKDTVLTKETSITFGFVLDFLSSFAGLFHIFLTVFNLVPDILHGHWQE